MISYAAIETPIGGGFVAWGERGVVALDTGVPEARFVARITDRNGEPPVRGVLPADLRRRIDAAIAGETAQAPVDLSALPPCRRKVLQATMKIPPGRVLSYGELAARVGHPGAARAVGTAMARNPVPLLVPCHRVVRGDGSIGEYGLGGPGQKRFLLEREGFAGVR